MVVAFFVMYKRDEGMRGERTNAQRCLHCFFPSSFQPNKMLFRPLVALSLFGIALATPFKRAESLKVSVTGPSSSINSIDDLKLTATVTNTGDEAVKILKYGTVLDDKLPTRSFKVLKDGKEVKFTGVKVRFFFVYLVVNFLRLTSMVVVVLVVSVNR